MDFPALRSNLRFTVKPDNQGGSYYLVEDPVSGEFFSFGEEEKFLCDNLNGNSSLLEVQAKYQQEFESRLDLNLLVAFVKRLERKGLLSRGVKTSPPEWWMTPASYFETWTRWKLFDPERSLNWLVHKFAWCYSKWFISLSFVICMLAVATVFFNFREVARGLLGLKEAFSMPEVLLALYLFVNLPAEVAKGMTTVRLGGTSTEFGVSLVYGVLPRFYCLSGIWGIPVKSGRDKIILTPSFVNILSASAGILVWKMTTPSVYLHGFALLCAAICVLAILVRLNVLWPTDSYYLLSNRLGIRSFRLRAIKTVKSWMFRRPMPEQLTLRDKRLFMAYGFLSVVATGITMAVLFYFVGKKLIDSLAGTGGLIIVVMLSIMYKKSFQNTPREDRKTPAMTTNESKYKKYAWRSLWVIIVVVVMLLPYPYEAGGPFRLLPLERIQLHTQVGGEIKEILVRENSNVNKGDVQAIVDTREHQKNLDTTRADLDKVRADLQLLEKGPKPEEVEKAAEQLEAARVQAEYSKKEEGRLKTLFGEGVIPKEEYEAAANRSDLDAKNLEVARAHLKLVRSGPRDEEIEAKKAIVRDYEERTKYYSTNIQLAKLSAPITGVMVTPYLETRVGQVLKEGELFAVYENSNEIQAEIQIPEADIGEIKIGADVKVRPYAYPSRFFLGKVALIAPKAEETANGRIVRVLTNIPNAEQELKPEMTGEAKVEGGRMPVALAFSRQLVRFVMVEIWSWLP